MTGRRIVKMWLSRRIIHTLRAKWCSDFMLERFLWHSAGMKRMSPIFLNALLMSFLLVELCSLTFEGEREHRCILSARCGGEMRLFIILFLGVRIVMLCLGASLTFSLLNGA